MKRRTKNKGRRTRTGLESRRGPGVRLTDERRAAIEGTMQDEQLELLCAVQLWKRVNRRAWPSWTEILEIFRQLGYRKVLPRQVRLDGAPQPKLWWNCGGTLCE